MNDARPDDPTKTWPGPSGWARLPALVQLVRSPPAAFRELVTRYGHHVRLSFQRGRDRYLVAHPDDVRRIFQENHKNYLKGDLPQFARRAFGGGLLFSDGEVWLHKRRLLQPLFTRTRVESYAPAMRAATETELAKWRPGATVSIAEAMTQITRKVITATMFSDQALQGDSELDVAITTIEEIFGRYTLSPRVALFRPPMPDYYRYHRAIAGLDRELYRFIRERRSTGRCDILDALLRARADAEGRALNDEELRTDLLTIFVAGHETTSTTLTWALALLARHPFIELAVCEELQRELGGRPPEVADLPRLRYLRAVIHETLRLYPAAFAVVRKAVDDDTLRDGFRLPAHQNVIVSPFVTHRLPEFWPDPDRFSPERFLRDEPVAHPGAYVPFAAGPRQCIGNHFALLEIQLILALTLQRFRIRPVDDVVPEFKLGLSLGVRGPLLSRVYSRC